jgi:hypothetical protein
LTIAALLGRARGGVTAKCIHPFESVLLAVADRVAEWIAAYLDGIEIF